MFEKLPFNKLRYKKTDLPSNKINDFVLPAITCTTENNGISCYVKKENATIFKNCISVAANGDAPVFYQSNEFTILQDAYVIDFKDKKLNKKENLFFTALLKKALKKFDWANKSGWERVKNENILLPTTQNGEIDFDFMESFIAELEENRVRELEAYLKASGLSDTTLSSDEKNALNTWNSRIWQEFKIGDFFDIRNTTGLNTDKLNDGLEYDYITRTSNNQGILQTTGLVNQSNLNEAGVWSLGLLQMDFFYRKRQWYAGQFVRKIIPKIKLSKNAILFFTTLLNYQKKILLSVLVRNVDETFKNLKIQLPITASGEIDFDFIESFIKAIQKECIKGVDSYLAKNIATTKEVINN